MRMRVLPVGFESLGVRSMCTFIQTADIGILIDAGVALAPRFGKPPHPREYEARVLCRSRIRECALKADVIIVSHYHNDHHTPNYTETVWLGSSQEEAEAIYRGKTVIVKDARNSINFSQRRRGWMFQRFIERIGSKLQVGDGAKFEFGATKLKLSKPVPHGEEESGLGWVIMTSIESGDEKFVHACDGQGAMSTQTAKMLLREKPDLLVLGGPPLYLAGTKVKEISIQEGMRNACQLAEKIPLIIFEHHALRSENWRDAIKPAVDAAASSNHKLITAAEYLGSSPNPLEPFRLRLYEEDPPSADFLKWWALPQNKRRQTPPPI